MPKILIIGKTPPPHGGVGVHIVRLMESLKLEKINYSFYDLRKIKPSIIGSILKSKIIHLHTSSVYFRLLIVIICKLLNKKLLFTYHGDLQRQNKINSLLDKISIKLCFIPIMINNKSYKIANRINKKTQNIPAFIPPLNTTPLPNKLKNKLADFKKQYKIIYCTNAYGLSYDKNGNEIYGILDLISIFSENKKTGLILSDTTGNYSDYIKNNNIKITANIFIITELHDFVEVIKLSDAFIRNTSTDGDSLSVKEALYFNKTVLATNVVDRPESTILYNNNKELISIINTDNSHNSSIIKPISGFNALRKLYKNIL